MNGIKSERLGDDFFAHSALSLAPRLLSCRIFRRFPDGTVKRFAITEVEVYMGEDDLACHASKGRTKRTTVLYAPSGTLYVYLIYGMHWLMNIVTGPEGSPQALLIRGLEGCYGPGRLTKLLGIDGSFNGKQLDVLDDLWLEPSHKEVSYHTGPRIGVDYAGAYWANIPWRFWVGD